MIPTGRSPIYNHANATLQGLTTIRAFKAQDILCNEFNTFQNFNSSAWYLYYALANSFAFSLEMTCLVYLATVLLSFLLYSDTGELFSTYIFHLFIIIVKFSYTHTYTQHIYNTFSSVCEGECGMPVLATDIILKT